GWPWQSEVTAPPRGYVPFFHFVVVIQGSRRPFVAQLLRHLSEYVASVSALRPGAPSPAGPAGPSKRCSNRPKRPPGPRRKAERPPAPLRDTEEPVGGRSGRRPTARRGRRRQRRNGCGELSRVPRSPGDFVRSSVPRRSPVRRSPHAPSLRPGGHRRRL